MSIYNVKTNTYTYTVIDIRKTFEGFEADLRMISRRTGKWTNGYVDNIFYDILKLAEGKYLNYVDITLLNSADYPLRAARYKVNENGTALNSDRPGGNDWQNLPNTRLTVILGYSNNWFALTQAERDLFRSNNLFKISWQISEINNSYGHLTADNAQLYGSKGYEVQKTNFR